MAGRDKESATLARGMKMKKLIPAASAALTIFLINPVFAQPAAPAPLEAETVKVQAATIPDSAVAGFVKTFTEPSALSGKIPRWYAPICLKTQGLARELGDAVTRRILQVAQEIGAPVDKQPCALNTTVIFDTDPQGVLDDIAAHDAVLLGPHDPAQTREVAKVRYPIQAWYGTETQDEKGVVRQDTKDQSPLCESIDMSSIETGTGDLKAPFKAVLPSTLTDRVRNVQRSCGNRVVTGNRLRDGLHSHLSTVTVVASMDTVRYHELAAVADYLALVILSQTKAFDKCEKMETVANLLVPACDLDNRIKGLMPGDMAFLKALYKADTGGTLVAQQASITAEMKKLLAAEAGR